MSIINDFKLSFTGENNPPLCDSCNKLLKYVIGDFVQQLILTPEFINARISMGIMNSEQVDIEFHDQGFTIIKKDGTSQPFNVRKDISQELIKTADNVYKLCIKNHRGNSHTHPDTHSVPLFFPPMTHMPNSFDSFPGTPKPLSSFNEIQDQQNLPYSSIGSPVGSYATSSNGFMPFPFFSTESFYPNNPPPSSFSFSDYNHYDQFPDHITLPSISTNNTNAHNQNSLKDSLNDQPSGDLTPPTNIPNNLPDDLLKNSPRVDSPNNSNNQKSNFANLSETPSQSSRKKEEIDDTVSKLDVKLNDNKIILDVNNSRKNVRQLDTLDADAIANQFNDWAELGNEEKNERQSQLQKLLNAAKGFANAIVDFSLLGDVPASEQQLEAIKAKLEAQKANDPQAKKMIEDINEALGVLNAAKIEQSSLAAPGKNAPQLSLAAKAQQVVINIVKAVRDLKKNNADLFVSSNQQETPLLTENKNLLNVDSLKIEGETNNLTVFGSTIKNKNNIQTRILQVMSKGKRHLTPEKRWLTGELKNEMVRITQMETRLNQLLTRLQNQNGQEKEAALTELRVLLGSKDFQEFLEDLLIMEYLMTVDVQNSQTFQDAQKAGANPKDIALIQELQDWGTRLNALKLNLRELANLV